MTSKQFEQIVHEYIETIGSKLTDFKAEHNVKVRSHDGTYQIDVIATFKALGVDYKSLIECKHHGRPLEQDVVAVLHQRMTSSGYHKGIVFSTSGFQSGAIRYAQAHGIGLVWYHQIKDEFENVMSMMTWEVMERRMRGYDYGVFFDGIEISNHNKAVTAIIEFLLK